VKLLWDWDQEAYEPGIHIQPGGSSSPNLANRIIRRREPIPSSPSIPLERW